VICNLRTVTRAARPVASAYAKGRRSETLHGEHRETQKNTENCAPHPSFLRAGRRRGRREEEAPRQRKYRRHRRKPDAYWCSRRGKPHTEDNASYGSQVTGRIRVRPCFFGSLHLACAPTNGRAARVTNHKSRVPSRRQYSLFTLHCSRITTCAASGTSPNRRRLCGLRRRARRVDSRGSACGPPDLSARRCGRER